MKILRENINKFLAEEEFFAYFKAVEKEDNKKILYEPIFKSKTLFDYLYEKDLIDGKYIEEINTRFGQFYTGTGNSKAILDTQLIIDFIYEREKMQGYSKEDIENFFLYNICKILAKNAKLESSSSNFSNSISIVDVERTYGRKEELEILPISQKVKNIKLKYYNTELLLEELEALRELVSDKNALNIIKNMEQQLKE